MVGVSGAGHQSVNDPTTRPDAIVTLHHGLGDVAMALPFLDQLSDATTGRILMLVKGSAERQFLELFEWPDRVEIVPISLRGAKLRLLGCWLRGAKALYTLHSSKGLRMPLLARLSRCKIRVGRPTALGLFGFTSVVTDNERVHKVNQFLHFLTASAGLPPPNVTDLSFNRRWKKGVLDPGAQDLWSAGAHPRIMIAPGSGIVERHKRWSPAGFADAISALRDIYPVAEFRIIGGPDERALCERIVALSNCAHPVVSAYFPATPRDLVNAVNGADCLIANCNGPSHIGALVGCPVVGLFGPTNPTHTGPLGARVFVVRVGLSCSPCYRDEFIRGCGLPICMELISIRAVVLAVAKALSGTAGRVPGTITTHRSRHCNIVSAPQT